MTINTNAALRTIADWPITDPANMDAVNMAQVARAALTTAAAVPPEGWVMVPVEPTKEMIEHAHHACDGTYAGDVYRAMVSAAPKAEPLRPTTLPLAITSAPERIWLDLGFNPYEGDAHFSDLHDLTWSKDNATGDGIEYVRVDLTSAPKAEPVQTDLFPDAKKMVAQPAGEYPPLPEPYHVAYDDIDKEDVKCFAEGQLRAYVDADRAMLAQAAPTPSEWDVRGRLAASLTCWHRLTGQEAAELVALFQGHPAQAAPQPAVQQGADFAELQRLADCCPELNERNYDQGDVEELNAWAVEVAQCIDRTLATHPAAPVAQGDAPTDSGPISRQWLTVVYRGVEAGDEVQQICTHPKVSAMSWSHALHDRDAARSQAKEGDKPT